MGGLALTEMWAELISPVSDLSIDLTSLSKLSIPKEKDMFGFFKKRLEKWVEYSALTLVVQPCISSYKALEVNID